MVAVQSTANCHRLASVGAQLEKNKIQQVKANVISWINENNSIIPRLWELMETEMIWELLSDSTDKHLPKCCVKVGSLSATHEKFLVNRGMEVAYTRELIKNMRAQDPKVMQKLFKMKFQWTNGYALKAALPFKDLFMIADARDKALGNRLSGVEVDSEGAIDWNVSGVYAFANIQDGKFVVLQDSYEDATHVYHKFADVGIKLSDLGCPTPDNNYEFLDNHDETIAQISDGKRMRIALFDDFKDNKFFDYENRFTEAWGSKTWRALCGEGVKESRDQAKSAIAAKEMEVQELRVKVAKEGVAPVAKRRRLSGGSKQ